MKNKTKTRQDGATPLFEKKKKRFFPVRFEREMIHENVPLQSFSFLFNFLKVFSCLIILFIDFKIWDLKK